MCGTEPFPTEFRAKKYKLEKHFLSKVDRFVVSQCWIPIFSPQEDFFFIMQNLPVHVPDEDIAEGSSSSTDHFGKLSKLALSSGVPFFPFPDLTRVWACSHDV